MELQAGVDRRRQVELRHPFLDRRLVEFCLALPEDQCQRFRTNKFVLRQAVGELLPGVVRERRSKAEFSCVFRTAIARANAREQLTKGTVARPDWVDTNRANAAFENYLAGKQPSWMWPLWTLYGIHVWHRVVYEANS
jgi:asparagine synthase (glutamine-hydrolysing)